MKITILKTHIANGAWAHAGTTADVSETRAAELVRSGLATPAFDAAKAPEAPAQASAAPADTEALETKSAPMPSNKAAPAPKNK